MVPGVHISEKQCCRKRAIEEGVLVDLSYLDAVRQHWQIDLGCTSAVWAIVQEAVQHNGKGYEGILDEISRWAKLAVGSSSQAMLNFQCLVGRDLRSFKLHCGPGDTHLPVLTLMLWDEDLQMVKGTVATDTKSCRVWPTLTSKPHDRGLCQGQSVGHDETTLHNIAGKRAPY